MILILLTNSAAYSSYKRDGHSDKPREQFIAFVTDIGDDADEWTPPPEWILESIIIGDIRFMRAIEGHGEELGVDAQTCYELVPDWFYESISVFCHSSYFRLAHTAQKVGGLMPSARGRSQLMLMPFAGDDAQCVEMGLATQGDPLPESVTDDSAASSEE